MTAHISGIPKKELFELYAESGFTTDVISVIHELSGGIMRDVRRLISQIDHVIGLNEKLSRQAFEPDAVRSVATKLNLYGGRK